jgi:hypothetical protein
MPFKLSRRSEPLQDMASGTFSLTLSMCTWYQKVCSQGHGLCIYII